MDRFTCFGILDDGVLDTMSKYQLMFEPLPGGWKYGFPRALPEEAVLGKGADLWINPAFDIIKYVAGFGFPADELHKWKLWPEEITSDGKMGDLKFTTAEEYLREEEKVQYVYPGQDCQE